MFIYLIIIRNLWKINDNEGNEFQEIRKKKKNTNIFEQKNIDYDIC